jgi:hypothetical protein
MRVQRYTETTIFSDGRTKLLCMSVESCEGSFPERQLQKALPQKVRLQPRACTYIMHLEYTRR